MLSGHWKRFDRKRGDLTVFDAECAVGRRSPRFALGRGRLATAAGLATLALILRLDGLAEKSFWYDKLVTWGRPKLPFAQLAVDAIKHQRRSEHVWTRFLGKLHFGR